MGRAVPDGLAQGKGPEESTHAPLLPADTPAVFRPSTLCGLDRSDKAMVRPRESLSPGQRLYDGDLIMMAVPDLSGISTSRSGLSAIKASMAWQPPVQWPEE